MSNAVRNAWKKYDSGDTDLAAALFEQATSESAEHAHTWIQSGLFYLRTQNYDKAISNLSRAAEISPKNPAPLFFLNIAFELQDQTEEADQILVRLEELSPRHQGLATLNLLKELRRGNPLKTLVNLGYGNPDLVGKAETAGGWKALAAGLGIGNPEWAPEDLSSSAYLMGPILLEIEKRLLPLEYPKLSHIFDDPIEEIEKNPVQKPGLMDEIRGLRQSLKGGKYLRKGRQLLAKALGHPDSEIQKKELRRAIAHLRLGKRYDDQAFRTNFYLGEAYLFSSKSSPGTPYLTFPLLKAEKYFLASARHDGINPYVLLYLAYTQHLLGRPKVAIDTYAKATEKFAKFPEAHYGSGQCYLLLGEPAKAQELMLKAISSELSLARERLNLFANLLAEHGLEHFDNPLPAPPVLSPPADVSPPSEICEEASPCSEHIGKESPSSTAEDSQPEVPQATEETEVPADES